MSETQIHQFSHEYSVEPARHEQLTDERLAELVNATGNHEGIALLTLALATEPQNDSGFTIGELHSFFQTALDAPQNVLGNRNNQTNWCDGSLVPAGLAVEVADSPRRIAQTQEGREVGAALAALVLDFSDRHDVPLVQIFGASMTRSPLSSSQIRLTLLSELLTNDGRANLTDLVTATGVASQVVIEKHLRKLNDAGLLQYEDWDGGENTHRFKITNPDYVPLASIQPITRTCLEFLKQHEEASIDEIVAYCETKLPTMIDEPSAVSFRMRVTRSLNNLSRSRAVEQSEGRKARQQVQVTFTPEQETMWHELLNSLEVFRSAGPVERAQYIEMGRDFLDTPAKVQRAIERYTERSSKMGVNLASLVLEVLADESSTGTVRNTTSLVSQKLGSAVSHFGINKILNDYTEQGRLEVVTDKVRRYRTTSTD